MRNNTKRIYDRLSRGEFLSVDSADSTVRHLYDDIEENLDDYADYFREIGLQLESGNGYFYFSHIEESRQTIGKSWKASPSGSTIWISLSVTTSRAPPDTSSARVI